MKKTVITLVLSILAVAAIAQTTKGSVSLGGSLGFRSDKEEGFDTDFGTYEFKATTISFAPTVGFFVADGMELGLSLGLSSTKRETEFEDGDPFELPTITETVIGPYFKYYMFTGEEKFAFTLNASLLFGFLKQSPEEGDDVKGSSLQFTVSPGFTYFFTNNIGLNFELQGIGFRTQDDNTDSESENDKTNTFIFGVSSLNPSLGFNYYFAR